MPVVVFFFPEKIFIFDVDILEGCDLEMFADKAILQFL